MDGLVKIIDSLWLATLTLLLALAGMVIIIMVRVVFRLPWRRATYGAHSRSRHSARNRTDPWKVSGNRLIASILNPNDED